MTTRYGYPFLLFCLAGIVFITSLIVAINIDNRRIPYECSTAEPCDPTEEDVTDTRMELRITVVGVGAVIAISLVGLGTFIQRSRGRQESESRPLDEC